MSRKRQHTCRGKRRYRDRQQAQRALRGLTKYSTRAKLPVRPYFCGSCKGWHLTSRETDRYPSKED